MKSRLSFLPSSLFVLILSMVALADQPMGRGGGGGGMGGPLPEEQRAIIHELAGNHKKLIRKVEMTEKGYVATTTSGDKELVKKLKTHFRYMKKRLDSGAMVRRWDPAYAEMTEFYDQLKVEVEELPNGLKVTITGRNAKAAKVAQNHAKIVTKFVKKGSDELHEKHPAAN
jgi:hypothetical protein